MLPAGIYSRRYLLGSGNSPTLPATNLLEFFDIQAPGAFTIDTTLCTYAGLNPIPTLSAVSGTLKQVPWWIGIRTGGSLGGGLISGISINGGSSFIGLTGGGVAQNIPLPASGFVDVDIPPVLGGGVTRVTFPAGVYSTGATYVSRVLSWTGTKGAYTFVQDVGQPASNDRGPILTARGRINNGLNRLGRGIMGNLAIATGSNGYLIETLNNLANAIGSGPFHIFLPVSYDSTLVSTTNQQVLLGLARNAANPRITSVDAIGDGAGNAGYTTARINNLANNGNQFIPSPLEPQANVIRIAFLLEIEFDGTNTTYRRTTPAGTTVLAGPANNSGGTFTLTQATLFALKRTTVANNATASMAGMAIYTAVQSGATVASIRSTLLTKYGITASKAMNVSIQGASLSAPSRGDLTWANVMMYGNDNVTVQNYAVPGNSLINDMIPQLPTFVASYNGALGAGHNIAFLWAEGVDLGINGGSGDLAGEKAATVTWVSTVKAAGFRAIVKTIIPGGTNPQFEINRNDYNAWLRAGNSGADAIDDQAARWPGTPGDNIWYDLGDNLHTSQQGGSWVAGSQEVGGSEQIYRYFSSLAA